MGAKFRGWLPNATGNISFSLIGGLRQPSECDLLNIIHQGRRVIACCQVRNLSDNLLFKHTELRRTAVHKFTFALLARSDPYGSDNVGGLSGWIFIHEQCPLDVAQARDAILGEHRLLRTQLSDAAAFAVSFRLERNGRCTFVVPRRMRDQTVEFGHGQRLTGMEALRPLVAQCIYFLRDITHRHQHHSADSDTLTSVWSADEDARWIRETLYELYRRVIISRRIRSPRGQEDALGIMAYIRSFEDGIAGPYRKRLEAVGRPSAVVPRYNDVSLRESLNASLEIKRRRRVQRNVVAAAIPAFGGAILALGNALYPREADWKSPTDLVAWARYVVDHPATAALYFMRTNEWLYFGVLVIGFLWVISFTGVFVPSDQTWTKIVAQLSASRGKALTSTVFGLLAVVLTGLIVWLLFR